MYHESHEERIESFSLALLMMGGMLESHEERIERWLSRGEGCDVIMVESHEERIERSNRSMLTAGQWWRNLMKRELKAAS